MTSDEIKALLKSTFPTLRSWKPWEKRTILFDPAYGEYAFQYMREIYEEAYQKVIETEGGSVDYKPVLNDCDDHALGIMYWSRIVHKRRGGHKVRPLGFLSGVNPEGLPHAFNFFVADGAIYITDYGRILGPDGYKPFLGIVI